MSKVVVIKNGDPALGSFEGLAAGILKTLINTTAQAKSLAPVDFGQLRNSIMYKTVGAEGGFNDAGGAPGASKISVTPTRTLDKIEGYLGANLDYAIYQEFGTRRQAPQPFLRPSIALVALGAKGAKIMRKIQKEKMNGALKRGQKRETFS